MMTSDEASGPLLVDSHLEVAGSLLNDAIVQRQSLLHVRGNVKGNLTIEKGANVIVEGYVDGKIVNRGGKLVVNNNGLAGFCTVEGPPEAEAAGVLRINIGALTLNWRALARRTQAEVAAVLKANAYGCGVASAASALGEAGCKTFFVSSLADARRIRASKADVAIYVLNGLLPGTGPVFAEINAQPVIGSLGEISEWDVFASSLGWTGGFALHVDTGSSRRGISVDEAAALAARTQTGRHGITLLMSHLDNPQTPDHPQNGKQIGLFQELRRLYRGIPASLADSAGIFLGPEAHFDMVRPGAALFGVNPMPGKRNPMLPVAELRGRIIHVRDLAAGETIASSRSPPVSQPTRIAIVSIGYADGYPRAVAGSGPGLRAIVGGQLCPLLGSVEMDTLAIDVTGLKNRRSASRGEMVTLIGGAIDAEEIAAAAQTTACELLSNIGQRLHRVYFAN